VNKLPAVPSQHRRAISPLAATFNADGHLAGFVRHFDLLNIIMPDFAMGKAISSNENLMQTPDRGAKSRSTSTMKLIEMECDKLISMHVFQIADKPAPNDDALFATGLLGP
jgi:hypothetical protein